MATLRHSGGTLFTSAQAGAGSSSRRVLWLIDKAGAVSHAAAAASLKLSPGTCNFHFQRLEREGLIRRRTLPHKGKGRPTVLWEINGSQNACITFVFDVPYFDASFVAFNGSVIRGKRVDLSGAATSKEVLAQVHDFIRRCLTDARRRDARIRQVFAAFPGLLHPETGAVIKAVNFPALDGIDLRAIIHKTYGLPCFTGSLGLAFFHGETETLPPSITAMVVHWDLGINAVFGRGHRILSFQASGDGGRPLLSEMGHLRIRRNGRVCHCGGSGCLEAYTGGWALVEQLRSTGVHCLGDVVQRVMTGDKKALTAARRAMLLLGQHLVVLLQALQVDRVILTGPMSAVFTKAAGAFRRGLLTALGSADVERLQITASSNSQARVQRGAFLLARRLFFHPEEYPALPQSPARMAL